MVHGVVQQSGGHVTVESPLTADGHGSRFTVYLPAMREAAARTPTDRRVAAGDASETVLLMGDDRNVQAFIGDVLRRRGYRLLQANDASHALRLAEEHNSSIDLLITTGADGVVVADALKERRPTTRVLYVSASADDVPDDRVSAILPQPFTPAALARKVRSVLTMAI
jgi:CheY-like chemotaxis protein